MKKIGFVKKNQQTKENQEVTAIVRNKSPPMYYYL